MNDQSTMNELKQEIIDIGKKSVLDRYVTTVGGNISVRLNQDQFLITATGIPSTNFAVLKITVLPISS